MINDVDLGIMFSKESIGDNDVDSVSSQHHIGSLAVPCAKCPDIILGSGLPILWGMPHDCSIIPYGIVFALVIAFSNL